MTNSIEMDLINEDESKDELDFKAKRFDYLHIPDEIKNLDLYLNEKSLCYQYRDEENSLVAYYIINENEHGRWLSHLYINPEYYGYGFSKKLLLKCIYTHKVNCIKWSRYDEFARRFLLGLNFKVFHEYKNHMDLKRM